MGGIGWWSALMVLVGTCHRFLVVVHAHGVVVAIHGCSWWVAEGSGGSFVGGGVGTPHHF